jgi:alpha-D-ribose 1-methylphosphonate 5-triphosphate synthase subunit PhnL
MDHHRGKSPLVTLLQANYEKDEGKTWENSPETAFFLLEIAMACGFL